MKKIITITAGLFLSFTFGFGQTIAPNWTLPDCNTVDHTLHTYLDSQEVVVMFFVMGCGTCTNAGNLVMDLKDHYDIEQPGKVNFFLMDYYPSNDCSDVTGTWSTYDFDAYFSGAWAEKDFYYPTLYPMPATVIAAGNHHHVVFDDLSWQNSDTTLIKQAIDHFFNTVSIEDQKAEQAIIYPNPATEVLYFDLSAFNQNELTISVYDMLGKKVPSTAYRIEDNRLVLMVSHLLKGDYILELQEEGKTIRKKFIKE